MQSYNIKFPIEDDLSTNRFLKTTTVTKEAISSDLLLLFLTQKGERYYEPDYGTNLLKFIFEPNNGLTANDIEAELKRITSKYIPTIKINKVTFNQLIDENGNIIPETQLNVNIKFTFEEDVFSEEGELDLNF